MELELIPSITAAEWDATTAQFDSTLVFHHSAWQNFLDETQPGETLRFRVTHSGRTEGYFLARLVRKGPFTILGSPLPGWTTPYMGPILPSDFDQSAFLTALEHLCLELRIDHVEISHPLLDPERMQAHGFRAIAHPTFLVPLNPDVNQMWARLKNRNSIHRARREGLTAEETADPSFVDRYYAQLREVFAKQQLVPTYSIERVRSLVRHLYPHHLLAIEVRLGNQSVATGLFPYDARTVYFWGGASWLRYQALRSNHLLHWALMCRAAQRSVGAYDIGGTILFKTRFGGTRVSRYVYSKSYSALARVSRGIYRSAFKVQQVFRGRVSQVLNVTPRS